jgi:cytochrome bd-type quinol oxidase subunit 2
MEGEGSLFILNNPQNTSPKHFATMWIIQSKFLTPKKFTAIVIFPFLITRDKNIRLNKALLNHEKIHFRQALELFVLPFYLWYAIEFLFRLIYYKNKFQAYRNISFEREAYDNETNLEYLKRRRFWSFLKYF